VRAILDSVSVQASVTPYVHNISGVAVAAPIPLLVKAPLAGAGPDSGTRPTRIKKLIEHFGTPSASSMPADELEAWDTRRSAQSIATGKSVELRSRNA